MAIKILISGFENTGKTTLISKIKDGFIINCDLKDFNYPIPHTNLKDWKGFQTFEQFINSKIKAYKEKNGGKLPKYVIFDTITQLYMHLIDFNSKTYKGFDQHSQNQADQLSINNYIEKTLIGNGINVIVVAHARLNKENRISIPAQGIFEKSGSWLSIVNEAIFIERNQDEHLIHLKSDYLPARSLMDYEANVVDMKSFDINVHLGKLEKVAKEAKEKYEF